MADMPNVFVEDIEELSREEWEQKRTAGIGGSDAGTIMGCNPYNTLLQLYWKKTGEKDRVIPETDPFRFEYGHFMEPFILQVFAAKNPEFYVYTKRTMFQHADYPWMLANCDAFAVDKRTGEIYVVELKTTTPETQRQTWGLPHDKNVPESYEWQGRHYIAVTGAVGCIFVCLAGNNDALYRQRVLMRDEELEAELIEKEREFWEEHVLKREPPQRSEDPTDILTALQNHYGATDEQRMPVELTGDLEETFVELLKLDDERKKLQREVKDMEKLCDARKAILVDALKGAPGIARIGEDVYDITSAPSNRKIIPSASFPELLLEFPEAEKYIKASDGISTSYKKRKKARGKSA